ncbi:hypothetical protein VCRA2110O318_80077 [Vibrio crassostreae]|nr:hypothetical protein VCRA2117O328_90077 [Vibrio crassostreae]CAK2359602.1 hypothetical protein VCRA2110O318_80077 [Vibrio crassostreae]CAK2434701.1 hypothetical protein VCRA2110O319_10151 [Vibrio crassostreae]CAK3035617.1 hypothetical protein VCRA217O317_80149 [Vibrio crassostreae]
MLLFSGDISVSKPLYRPEKPSNMLYLSISDQIRSSDRGYWDQRKYELKKYF